MMTFKKYYDSVLFRKDKLDIFEISCPFVGLTDLIGIEECINLIYLDIDDNLITDLSPLKKLKKLSVIYCRCNQITDLTPLAYLPKIESIVFYDNPELVIKYKNYNTGSIIKQIKKEKRNRIISTLL